MNPSIFATNIKNLVLAELEKVMASLGERPYRARQVFGWVYRKGVTSFDEMTDLSKGLRDRLKGVFYISLPEVLAVESSSDGTKKLLLELEDKNCIECVLIPEEDRLTLCVSTQVGCAFECRFCATGRGGFLRNLKLSEMVDQVLVARRFLSPGMRITNIVLMGMGEPLANYDEVSKFFKITTDELGFAVRKVTLSTVGLVPEMERLGKESKVNLAVSLNATTDDVRSYLMPINKRYPLKVLLASCRRYPLPRGRRITFEYVMIKGVNDSMEDARRLVNLLKGIPCKINLIPFNPLPGEGIEFERPDEVTLLRFQDVLIKAHYSTFVRISKGQDIQAACGQLRGRYSFKSQVPSLK